MARAVALGACVANPLTLLALELGHAEELLGGALCVAAVLLAARDRPLWAGVVLGLDALLLLALLLLRCVLDTWDTVYYPIPFVLTLLAWECLGEQRRPVTLALSSTVMAWISFRWLPLHFSADAQAAFFIAWTLPLTALLGLSLYAPGLLSRRPRAAQEMTVSSLGSPVRTS